MPNVKVFIDDRRLPEVEGRTHAILTEIRAFLCVAFGVTEPACHLVVIPVRALAGQTPVNIELVALHRPDRPRDRVDAACAEMQLLAGRLFGMAAAIRCTLMDPESYVTRK